MNWKITLVLSASVPLAVAFGACGEDDCSRAADQLANCAIPSSASSSSSGMTMEMCAGAFLCKSDCINNYTCDQINGNYPPFTNCIAACNGK
jgi:hypothetical protein